MTTDMAPMDLIQIGTTMATMEAAMEAAMAATEAVTAEAATMTTEVWGGEDPTMTTLTDMAATIMAIMAPHTTDTTGMADGGDAQSNDP